MTVQNVCVFVLVGLALATASAQSGRFAVAVARMDGAIVPIAAYSNGQWERAWPEADEERVGRLAIEAIPSVWQKRGEAVPTTWTAWPAAGGKQVQATVSGVQIVEAHCGAQIALRTNLPPVKADHPGKFGIAIDSTTVQVGQIDEVKQSDPAWAAAQRVILAAFSRSEAAEAAGTSRQLPPEAPPPVPVISVLYREARSPRSPLYFVAEKKYRTTHPQDPQCNIVTVFTGWLVPTEDGGIRILSSRTFLTDCDQKTVRTAMPLGAIRDSGRLFWVLQEHGYEDESYIVAEIGPEDVRELIEVNGGGC